MSTPTAFPAARSSRTQQFSYDHAQASRFQRVSRFARSVDTSESRLRALYARHAAAVVTFLLPYTGGDRQWAEDILQETMIRAWRHLDRLDWRRPSLRPWLCTVARRIALDDIRSRRARPVEVDLSLLERGPAVDQVERLLVTRTVMHAIRSLPPAQQEVLTEVYLRGSTTRETAALLGIPVGTVKSRAFCAVRTLRAHLGDVLGS